MTVRIPRKGQKVVMRIPWPAYGAKGCYEDCWRAVTAKQVCAHNKQKVVTRIKVVITSKQVCAGVGACAELSQVCARAPPPPHQGVRAKEIA